MSYRNGLDPRSELFRHNWTRPKRAKCQVNGETQETQALIVLAKETRKRRF
ncbi:YpzG family protein [Ectobacillus polymachus]|uniref:YpzG family protein n=1 Tax=Ectobacillus polymachus TaxID=1508806 RepID=UPI003A864690